MRFFDVFLSIIGFVVAEYFYAQVHTKRKQRVTL